MYTYVVDTHALAWFVSENKRLASYYQAILITRDEMVQDFSKVKTIWD